MLGAWLRSSVVGLGRGSRSSGGDRGRSQPAQKHVARARIVLQSAERLTSRRWRGAPGSAGRRCGAGSGATPRPGWMGCCATRPASLARRSSGRCHRAPGAGADLCRAAGRGHPLDRPGDGQDGRDHLALGAADLGRRTTCSRTACAPSSARPIPPSRPSSRTSSACTWTRRRQRWCCRSREEPDPGARPHPAGPAAEAGQGRDDDPRLQAQRHDHAVRRLNVLDGTVVGRCMAAPPPPGVPALPERDRSGRCRRAR